MYKNDKEGFWFVNKYSARLLLCTSAWRGLVTVARVSHTQLNGYLDSGKGNYNK